MIQFTAILKKNFEKKVTINRLSSKLKFKKSHRTHQTSHTSFDFYCLLRESRSDQQSHGARQAGNGRERDLSRRANITLCSHTHPCETPRPPTNVLVTSSLFFSLPPFSLSRLEFISICIGWSSPSWQSWSGEVRFPVKKWPRAVKLPRAL